MQTKINMQNEGDEIIAAIITGLIILLLLVTMEMIL